MADQQVTHSTFVIERNYPVAPQKVFAAFADPVQKRRWFAEGEKSAVVSFEADFRVGGTERSQFRLGEGTPVAGSVCTNETVYLDIVTDRRIVWAYSMALGVGPFSASLVTVELVAEGGGTRLVYTEQGAYFEGSDGAQMREQGWGKLLGRLAAELGR